MAQPGAPADAPPKGVAPLSLIVGPQTARDDMLKAAFPNGQFAPPATEQQVGAVESALGVRFPEQLRALYLECNGFREDRGNAKYLLSLTDEDFIGSLITLTRFHWTEVKEYWPQLDLSPYIFFGSSSGDEMCNC